MQSTNEVFLVRPANFGFNAETAESNVFQKRVDTCNANEIALQEFDNFADTLIKNGVNVNVFKDTAIPVKPDSIFPNNWISFHNDGTVVLYPMCAINRRRERRKDIIDEITKKIKINRIVDLSYYEQEENFLEGTGSVVFDRVNKIAYACLSPRTNKKVLEKLCSVIGYSSITFNASDANAIAVYHTNVMMSIGTKYATVCLESIKNEFERKILIESLEKTGHKIVNICFLQMNNFAGNMLELRNNADQKLIVMSQSAFDSLDNKQKTVLSSYCNLVSIPINTIETIGGGSARCMIAEMFPT